MVTQFKVRMAYPLPDVVLPPGEKVINHNNFMALTHEQINQIGTHEACTSSDEDAFLLPGGSFSVGGCAFTRECSIYSELSFSTALSSRLWISYISVAAVVPPAPLWPSLDRAAGDGGDNGIEMVVTCKNRHPKRKVQKYVKALLLSTSLDNGPIISPGEDEGADKILFSW
eukprot:CAMPEP_0114525146 /NCGR_PEP_ID=MMETSP0109-20121206/22254_1 /TAXON_ID=29199 /ORGANISM="Chlorarachnion reptans, Strain CCCM449" /LENGTH=170 /DNA_ID=CAMNT_0001706679 /DNA_START=1088 /DNA_END=1598 /DNA_ORIENTATION=-